MSPVGPPENVPSFEPGDEQQDTLFRLEAYLTGCGFLPLIDGESRIAGFADPAVLCNVIERDGIEILSAHDTRKGLNRYVFSVVIGIPLEGPITGFEKKKELGTRTIWYANLYLEAKEPYESAVQRLDALIDGAQRAIAGEPDKQPHDFIDHVLAEAGFAKMRRKIRSVLMRTILMGNVVGFLVGSNVGSCIYKESNAPVKAVASSATQQPGAETDDMILTTAQVGMFVGSILGFAVGRRRVIRLVNGDEVK